jgi:hypothetical protein
MKGLFAIKVTKPDGMDDLQGLKPAFVVGRAEQPLLANHLEQSIHHLCTAAESLPISEYSRNAALPQASDRTSQDPFSSQACNTFTLFCLIL